MLKDLGKAKAWLLDILLPRTCLGCGKEGKYVCDECEIFLGEAPPPQEEGVFSVWEYEGLMEELIRKIKYNGMYDIINELVERAFEKITLDLPKDISITYVPMYKKQERGRGFNQAELIAKKVGKMIGKEVLPLLIKIKDNKSQVGLSPQERIENVKDVFAMAPKIAFSNRLSLASLRSARAHTHDFQKPFSPSDILLVDDVYTTGATAKECIRVLKKAGVKNIWVFTLARKLSL